MTVIPAPEPGAKAEGLSGPDAAAAFAAWLDQFPLPITTIDPDRNTGTPTYYLANPGEVRAFAAEESGKKGVYYTLAQVEERTAQKPSKSHLRGTRFFHADLDSPYGLTPDEVDAWIEETLERIRSETAGWPPSAIIRSGNGLHLIWRLDNFFDFGDPADKDAHKRRIAEIESRTRGIRVALDADRGTHNIDRLLRLPGPDNVPNRKKRAGGRVRRETSIVYLSDRTHPLEAFPQVWEDDDSGSGGNDEAQRGAVALEREAPIRLNDPAELEEWGVPDKVKMLIVLGDDPDNPYPSRSDAQWYVTCELLRRRVPPARIVGILTDETWLISGHVLDQKRSDEYAWEQVENATAEVAAQAETFATDKDGKPYRDHQGNIRLAVRKLGVELRHDTFADRTLIAGLDGFGPNLDDAALVELWLAIDGRFGFRPSFDFFVKVLMNAARNAPCHPVIEYLDALEWDGTPRLDQWLSTYGGAEDSDYTRAVGALVLVAAVRRVRQPGVKFDEMLVLESAQGTNKSSALRVMAVRDEWFVDDLPLNADGKRVIEQTSGKWIIEAGELKGMRKGEVEHLKAFLSRQEDTARMSYERLPVIVPRQCVIIGTTNSERYLRDLTGNRRFWPVRVEGFDLEALRRDRDQLWAEAAAREAERASIRLDPSLYAAAGVEQEARRVEDPFVAALAAALGDRTGKVRATDVWKLLGIPAGQQTQDQNARVGDAMRELGWERTRRRFGSGGREYAYARGSRDEMERPIEVCLGAGGWYVDDAPGGPVYGDDDGGLPY